MIHASFSLEMQRRHETSLKFAESSLIYNTGQLWQQETAFSHDSSDSLDSAWPRKSLYTTGMGDSRIVFFSQFKGGIELHTKSRKTRLFATKDNFDSMRRLSAMLALILWIVHGQGNPFIPREWVIHALFSLEIQRRYKTSHKIAESSIICNTGQLWQQLTACSHDSSDSLDSLWPVKFIYTTGMGDWRIVFPGNSKAA